MTAGPDTARRLRLRAADPDDLSVIAACLQDALIPISEMAYLADERRFMAAFTRFRRECLADPTCCEGLTQCLSVLCVEGVEAVKYRGLDCRLGGVKLELLTIAAEPAADGLAHVTLLFAADIALRLDVASIDARLDDFGEPQAAKAVPSHELVPDAVGTP